jgi:uncharacterized membrane protein
MHEFMSGELQKDRDHFDRIFKRTTWFLAVLAAVLVLVGGFFGVKTIQEARDTAKNEASRAMEDEVRRLRATVEYQIQKRIDEEIRSDRIQKLIETVVAERAANVLQERVDTFLKAKRIPEFAP